jgi:hypothetical protein
MVERKLPQGFMLHVSCHVMLFVVVFVKRSNPSSRRLVERL